MTGFSASWLALREGADHRSRNGALGAGLARRFVDASPVRVMDFGAGTGSNLRATAPLLGETQEWTLVDYDPALLEAAAQALKTWADSAQAIGDQLVLLKGGKSIGVTFRIADLNAELETLLDRRPDLVTASALFDLISEAWIARFAKALASRCATFFTVLTYDGRDSFLPEHPLDHAVIGAFARHQGGDKGFGPAAGPRATAALAAALRAEGYAVETADSPWVLKPEDAGLVMELLGGIAGAVAETGAIAPDDLSGWLDYRREAARRKGARLVTGHTDLLALKT